MTSKSSPVINIETLRGKGAEERHEDEENDAHNAISSAIGRQSSYRLNGQRAVEKKREDASGASHVPTRASPREGEIGTDLNVKDNSSTNTENAKVQLLSALAKEKNAGNSSDDRTTRQDTMESFSSRNSFNTHYTISSSEAKKVTVSAIGMGAAR